VPERRNCRLLLEGWWRPVNVKIGCHKSSENDQAVVLRSTAKLNKRTLAPVDMRRKGIAIYELPSPPRQCLRATIGQRIELARVRPAAERWMQPANCLLGRFELWEFRSTIFGATEYYRNRDPISRERT
jgi:hypothetical protein